MKKRLRTMSPVRSEFVSAQKFISIYETNKNNIAKTEFIMSDINKKNGRFGKFKITYRDAVLRECYE